MLCFTVRVVGLLSVFFILFLRLSSWRRGMRETRVGGGRGHRLEVTQQTNFSEQESGHEQAPGFAEPFSSFLATRYKLIYLVRKTWFIAI